MSVRSLTVGVIALLFTIGCSTTPPPQAVACEASPVFMVVSGITLDRERMGAYAKAIADTGIYAEVSGYYLNNPRPAKVLEGTLPDNYVALIVRFPSQAAAEAFWYSDVYQNTIRPLRWNPPAGVYTVVLYDEIDIAPYIAGRVTEPAFSADVACDGGDAS